jgi:molecular chaperone GrpE
MIQRSLLRASRSVNTRLPSRTFTSLRSVSPFLRPQLVSPSSSRIASRWYSDAAPAKEEAKPEEPSKTEGAEVEALKKELEAKNKEIIDLKVRSQ